MLALAVLLLLLALLLHLLHSVLQHLFKLFFTLLVLSVRFLAEAVENLFVNPLLGLVKTVLVKHRLHLSVSRKLRSSELDWIFPAREDVQVFEADQI